MITITSLLPTLVFIAAIGSGLVAGIFFSFSNFVISALNRLQPRQSIAAMQAINVAVLNPLFFSVFFGTGAVCLLVIMLSLLSWSPPSAIFLIIGSLLYLVGTVLVTMRRNVPLNKVLANLSIGSTEDVEHWDNYYIKWTYWNHVRTVAALMAAIMLTTRLCT
ncbi:MAG: DUF1772 domain-containing protein [Methylophilaceae bacterium]|nr:DUF1772 domain-containing protein [Methylophilaceae bacterium]